MTEPRRSGSVRSRVLCLCLLALSTRPGLATGPSYLTIQLRPVAMNAAGDLLFRTRQLTNPSGAYDTPSLAVGWLLAGPGGRWIEATQGRVEAGESQTKLDGLERRYARPFDPGDPTEPLPPVIDARGPWLPPPVPRPCAARWSPAATLPGPRSIGGLESIPGEGSPVAARHCLASTGVFNHRRAPPDEVPVGALFQWSSGPRDSGGRVDSLFDYWDIETISPD